MCILGLWGEFGTDIIYIGFALPNHECTVSFVVIFIEEIVLYIIESQIYCELYRPSIIKPFKITSMRLTGPVFVIIKHLMNGRFHWDKDVMH